MSFRTRLRADGETTLQIMNREQLFEQIKKKRSFLCVGLDTDVLKVPAHLRDTEDALFEFNRAIIDATAPYTVAFKLNLAFYEARAVVGVEEVAEVKQHRGIG